jgi:hypothetical protein
VQSLRRQGRDFVRAGLFNDEQDWMLWAMERGARYLTPKKPMAAMQPFTQVPHLTDNVAALAAQMPQAPAIDRLEQFAIRRTLVSGTPATGSALGAQMKAAAAWMQLSQRIAPAADAEAQYQRMDAAIDLSLTLVPTLQKQYAAILGRSRPSVEEAAQAFERVLGRTKVRPLSLPKLTAAVLKETAIELRRAPGASKPAPSKDQKSKPSARYLNRAA